VLILVAADGSDCASRAVLHAAELARTLGGRLKILHVIEPWPAPDPLIDYKQWMSDLRGGHLWDRSRSILDAARKKASEGGCAEIETGSAIGDAAATIIKTALEDRPELIVLGKRGRSQAAGLLLGSVSQKVMTCARCKVLVVP
jgi:nucleotide-binding universal stress UspA family protein